MKKWYSLIISLPTENANERMRAWRALKAAGAAVLRDGVYLMPDRPACRQCLEGVAADVVSAGGIAYVIRLEEPDATNFISLFDRNAEYAVLLEEVCKARNGVSDRSAPQIIKQTRKLRKSFTSLTEIDFFGSEAQKQTQAALQELELALARLLSPDEPSQLDGKIKRLQLKNFQGKTWATRQRPWVDRLACAWLIKRFIDSKASFLWLDSPKKCPAKALGFDFDGAAFSHVGAKVTFEVMLASFGLETPALQRMGHLVHFLDVGGMQPPEASGIECVLAGLRDSIPDDDRFIKAAFGIFDGLLKTFSKEVIPHGAS